MTEHLYVVMFDQLDPRFDPLAVRNSVRSDARISHFWNHIPNCFMVTTDRSAASLTAKLKQTTGDIAFLVIEADPHNSEGHLPDRSWEWIRRREQERAVETS